MVKEGTQNILQIAHDFYKKLYTKENECSSTQDRLLQNIDIFLTNEARECLNKEIDQRELKESMLSMKNSKSPGSDGLGKEFYEFFWEDLCDFYDDVVKEIFETDELSRTQQEGLIKIAYKKNGRHLLKNYRPLSLQNFDVKIIAKSLAKRMALYINDLIHDNQKCVPGRKITTNIHIAQDLIDTINANGDKAAFIFIDQEKAFDRISHNFMIKTLIAFGFPENFIKWVKILYNNITSRVKINGFLTESFDIERGVRQGCPLSSLIYVLCAEVLAIEIRKNDNIQGYKYNNFQNEQKLLSFADDMKICIITDQSLFELFKVLHDYELASNAKVNQDKTKALWIGQWQNRTDTPLGLKWTNGNVEFLGPHIGNDRESASRITFEIVKNSIKNKISYWNPKHISLKGKAKILNIFVLSKLWSTLEILDIPDNTLDELNRMIKAYFWNDLHQRELKVICYPYHEGGLNLQSIVYKMNAFRIKWLSELLGKDSTKIERWLADHLIGTKNQVFGLKIINYRTSDLNHIKNSFYRKAVKIWQCMNISYRPKNITSIKNDYIYENILLKDDDGRVYKPPGYYQNRGFPSYVPLYFKNLPVTFPLTQMNPLIRSFIPKINKSFFNLTFSNDNESHYFIIDKNNTQIDLNKCEFKVLYREILDRNIDNNKIWVNKWKSEFQIEEQDWLQIWENIHDNLNNYQVQSSMWELLHRNYMCAYFAKLVFNKSGNCKLCGKLELKRVHIITDCETVKKIIENFDYILALLHTIPLTPKEIIFGISAKNKIDKKLHNYIMFAIRHVIYRSRNKTFDCQNTAVIAISNRIKVFIRSDLKNKFFTALYKNEIQNFKDTYLYNNILGKIENNELEHGI